MEPGQSVYSLDISTLQVSSGQAEVMLKHEEDRYRMEISALTLGGFRVKIREAFPLVPRFEVPEVLVSEPEVHDLTSFAFKNCRLQQLFEVTIFS